MPDVPTTVRRRSRGSLLLFPILATLLLAGCTGMPEHLSGHQSTFVTEGPLARMQLDLFYVTLWVTTFIFITVGGVLAYAQIKFKAKKGEERSEPPAQTHGNPLVELGLIVASIGLLVIIAIPTVRGIWYMETIPYDDEDMVEIVATGYQWWFRFDYTDLGFTTANEVVIPAGRNVHFHLRTNDVIHSFWIPRLAGKKDMIPNRANSMWIRADGPGYYWGHCAEFCGESHANMRFRVISLEEDEWEAWVARQQEDARTVTEETVAATAPREDFRIDLASLAWPSGPRSSGAPHGGTPMDFWRSMQEPPEQENPELIAEGRRYFRELACIGCHTIRGHESMGITGPDLTHYGSRTTIASALLDNTPENLYRWLRFPEHVKPGNIMYRDGYAAAGLEVTSEQAEAMVAYLLSLK